jgi:hypothetical protein
MPEKLSVHVSLAEFIQTVLLNDLRRMVYDANLHYLAFGTIAVGIEFLGACKDSEPFNEEGLSKGRFGLGIQRLAKIDRRYTQFNQNRSPYCLYKLLRCGTAHVMRPAGPILFTQRLHCAGQPEKHLDVVDGKLLLVCEDFYDHFAQGCESLIKELPRMRASKLKDPYMWVGEVG